MLDQETCREKKSESEAILKRVEVQIGRLSETIKKLRDLKRRMFGKVVTAYENPTKSKEIG